MNLDIGYIFELLPLMVSSAKNTIIIAVCALVLSLIIATMLALFVENRILILCPFAKIYISFFRGTPLLVQLYLIYFGLPKAFPILMSMTAFTAIVVALSLNTAAYMAEIIRGAITSVSKGQSEAGLSIGLSSFQVFRKIIFPQAIRVAVPALANCFVDLIKGSSMAFTIGVVELMSTANREGGATYKFLEAFIAAALVYWTLVTFSNFVQRRLEKYFNVAY